MGQQALGDRTGKKLNTTPAPTGGRAAQGRPIGGGHSLGGPRPEVHPGQLCRLVRCPLPGAPASVAALLRHRPG